MVEMLALVVTGAVTAAPVPVVPEFTLALPTSVVVTLWLLSATKSVAGPVVARYIAPEVPPVPVLLKVALAAGAGLPGPFEVALSVEEAVNALPGTVTEWLC